MLCFRKSEKNDEEKSLLPVGSEEITTRKLNAQNFKLYLILVAVSLTVAVLTYLALYLTDKATDKESRGWEKSSTKWHSAGYAALAGIGFFATAFCGLTATKRCITRNETQIRAIGKHGLLNEDSFEGEANSNKRCVML